LHCARHAEQHDERERTHVAEHALATGRQTDQQLADKITYSGDLNHGRKVTSALNMMI
jgi:hypothetical protein